MRLFVAIEIAPEIRDRIVEFISTIRSQLGSARWSHPEGLHITLKFLGNVPDQKRRAIEKKLGSVKSPSFSMTIGDAGAFPNAKSPRVLWVGLDAPTDLARLAEQVDIAMSSLGFEREQRVFTPHVTLARFNGRGNKLNVGPALSSVPEAGFGTMTATEFHLYESKLSPQGSRYIKLASFPLS
jgi:RNA 2',3'-cyclic 3'-phosphodiesterase